MNFGKENIPYKFCISVDGGWSLWGSFSICTTTCGPGQQIRRRTCNNPVTSNGGKPCKGSSEELRQCSGPPCPGRSERISWISWTFRKRNLVFNYGYGLGFVYPVMIKQRKIPQSFHITLYLTPGMKRSGQKQKNRVLLLAQRPSVVAKARDREFR